MLTFFRRLRARVRHRHFARELREELAVHRAMKEDELDQAGRALDLDRALGNELRMREHAKDVWMPPSLESLAQDVRDALRLLVRRPMFTLASMAALVVGVGAATLAYSLASALLLRPLPVERPEELVYLNPPSFSYPILQEVRARATFLTGAFGWTLEQYDTDWNGTTERSLVLLATGNAYPLLGVTAAIGRVLNDQDDRPGAAPVGVLSYATWQQRFGGASTALGQIVRVHGVPVTIVGVTPPGFFGVAPGRSPEITVPVGHAERLSPSDGDMLAQAGRAWLHIMGRRQRGVSLDQANAQFQVAWKQVLEAVVDPRETPERRARYLSRSSNLVSGTAGFSSVRNQYKQPLLILAGLTALLWLVSCVTVANLLVAGAWGRSRELAMRLALGCGRARLARQVLIEGLVLAVLAAAVAVLLARWSGQGLVALLATSTDPVMLDFVFDWRLSSFLAAIIVASALVYSGAPIVLALRVDPGESLKASARTVTGQGRGLGRLLVSVQTAVSVVLLVGAALLLRSFGHLLTVDPGFDAQRLLVAEIDPSGNAAGAADIALTGEPLAVALDDAVARVAQVPGLVSASLAMYPPVSHRDGSWTQTIGVDDAAPVETGSATFFNAVSPRFFATTGTRLVAGREFSDADGPGAERVAIVNESLAARAFPGQSAIGHRITVGLHASRQSLTIVGIVADATYQRMQEAPRAIAYLPLRQTTDALTGGPIFLVARAANRPLEIADGVRAALLQSNARFAVRAEPLGNRIRESLITERILAVLASGLAGAALFLACAGLFGLLMQVVARRTQEIGVRIALGARPADVVRPVLGHAIGLAAIGVGVGVAVAWGSAGVIRGVLHGIGPDDPISYLTVAGLTLVVAAAAGFIPARRAARINPIEALRAE